MSGEHFCATDGDVILRSADGQEFRVHKTILSIASPVFRDMFTIPQPPSPEPSLAPVIDMCEAGNVLDVFLRCIYPVPKPVVEDFELLEALATPAEKYETEVVLDMLKLWLVTPENLRKDPLRIYAIACTSTAFDEQAKVAAKWMTPDTVYSARLDTIARLATMDHHRLVTYLVKREKEASLVIDKPPSSIFYTSPLCACKTETKADFQVLVNKALLDAFVSDPSLTTERAIVLACKQLAKVRPCYCCHGCSLVNQGEQYTRQLMQNLVQMSDRLLW